MAFSGGPPSQQHTAMHAGSASREPAHQPMRRGAVALRGFLQYLSPRWWAMRPNVPVRSSTDQSRANAAETHQGEASTDSQDAWSDISELYPPPPLNRNAMAPPKTRSSEAEAPKPSIIAPSVLAQNANNHGNAPKVEAMLVDSSLAQAVETVMHAYEVLARRRNEMLLLHAQRGNAMQNYLDKRRFTEESILALVETFSFQTEPELARTPVSSFETIKKQLQDDGSALSSQSRVLLDLVAKSDSLQYDVAEADDKFVSAFTNLLHVLPGGESLAQQHEARMAAAEAPQPSDSDEIPEDAERYFDQMGSIKHEEERLAELEAQHREGRAIRDFARDQDRELSIPDDEFEQRYQQTRYALEEKLRQHREQATLLRQDCDSKGIDLDQLRYRQHNISSSTHSPHQDSQILLPAESATSVTDGLVNMRPAGYLQLPRNEVDTPANTQHACSDDGQASVDHVHEWLTRVGGDNLTKFPANYPEMHLRSSASPTTGPIAFPVSGDPPLDMISPHVVQQRLMRSHHQRVVRRSRSDSELIMLGVGSEDWDP